MAQVVSCYCSLQGLGAQCWLCAAGSGLPALAGNGKQLHPRAAISSREGEQEQPQAGIPSLPCRVATAAGIAQVTPVGWKPGETKLLSGK